MNNQDIIWELLHINEAMFSRINAKTTGTRINYHEQRSRVRVFFKDHLGVAIDNSGQQTVNQLMDRALENAVPQVTNPIRSKHNLPPDHLCLDPPPQQGLFILEHVQRQRSMSWQHNSIGTQDSDPLNSVKTYQWQGEFQHAILGLNGIPLVVTASVSEVSANQNWLSSLSQTMAVSSAPPGAAWISPIALAEGYEVVWSHAILQGDAGILPNEVKIVDRGAASLPDTDGFVRQPLVFWDGRVLQERPIESGCRMTKDQQDNSAQEKTSKTTGHSDLEGLELAELFVTPSGPSTQATINQPAWLVTRLIPITPNDCVICLINGKTTLCGLVKLSSASLFAIGRWGGPFGAGSSSIWHSQWLFVAPFPAIYSHQQPLLE